MKNLFITTLKCAYVMFVLCLIASCAPQAPNVQYSDNGDGTFNNPVIFADVPDPDITRVGDTFYMVSTTMHYSPGCTIMKSKDLVNWTVIGYAYDYIEQTDSYSLRNGQNDYANGSWAANIRYDKYEERFYVIMTCNTTATTYIFSTKDIEHGPWHRSETPKCYDPALLFADNGTSIDKYVIYPSDNLKCYEAYMRTMTTDANGNVVLGDERIMLPYTQAEKPAEGLRAEGYHGYKVGDYYYIWSIQGQGIMRQVIIWRTKDLYADSSEWELKKIFNGHMYDTEGNIFMRSTGIAQGGMVSLSDNTEGTTDGTWYSFLFQDYGAVGRIPVLLPMAWDEEGWPVIGSGKQNDGFDGTPAVLEKPVQGGYLASPMVSDEFDNGKMHYQLSDRENTYAAEFAPNGSNLKIEWQWNHNPDMRYWSLTERKGWLRLSSGTTVPNIRQARNTLTQRTYGPQCSGKTKVDVSGMQDGDICGITSFQNRYGFIGVEMKDGKKNIVMHRAQIKGDADGITVESIPLSQDVVYLRIDHEFGNNRKDMAYFYYSLDNKTWNKLGSDMKLFYDWPDFVGQRIGLFFFSTENVGGHADFDYFHYGTELITDTLN